MNGLEDSDSGPGAGAGAETRPYRGELFQPFELRLQKLSGKRDEAPRYALGGET